MWPLVWLKNGSLFQVTLRVKNNNAIINSSIWTQIEKQDAINLRSFIIIFINDKGPFPYVRTILIISFLFMLFKDRDSDLLVMTFSLVMTFVFF